MARKPKTPRTSEFDVIIIGGGMVGATIATGLGKAGIRCALVEKNPPDLNPGDDISLRVSAITLASQRILTHVGAWPMIEHMRAKPFTEMQVWDQEGFGAIHFDCADVGEPVMGHIIENNIIVAGLWKTLPTCADITTYCPAEVENIERDDEKMRVTLSNSVVLNADLLIGAEGANSIVRDFAGIELKVSDYQQSAIAANIKPEQWHRDTAWQRFTPTGPIAFLPITDELCSIVWSNDTARAEEIMALDDDEFCKQLYAAFDGRLGLLELVSERAAFPLIKRHAVEYVQPGLALAGDAAHTVHPLAGQGVNLGLADAAVLIEELVRARAARRPLGDLAVLRRYQRRRKGDNLLMQNAMSAFKHLFGSTLPPVSLARSLGMGLTNHLPPAKNLINRYAMGLEGDLANMAKPPVS